MRHLIHFIPIALHIALCQLYTWLNISTRIFVERFGCGCPPIDGSWRFNTNHFTMIILGGLMIGGIVSYLFLTGKIPTRYRVGYLLSASSLVVVIVMKTFGQNCWL